MPMVSGKQKYHFKDRIQKLVKCWQKCIDVGGYYAAKWSYTGVNKD
jgi:hypothetical protein